MVEFCSPPRARTQGTNGYTSKKSSPSKGRATVMSNAIFNVWQVAQIPAKFAWAVALLSGELVLL